MATFEGEEERRRGGGGGGGVGCRAKGALEFDREYSVGREKERDDLCVCHSEREGESVFVTLPKKNGEEKKEKQGKEKFG